ncbi:MAG: protein-tyrosine-phosphatase [Bacteroidota bacterium]
MVYQNLKELIQELEKRSDEIPLERKELLNTFAYHISKKINKNENVDLIFICTHNSRRSHMAQIWAQTASEYFKVKNVNCFSGGTEATAFNSRAVKTVQKAGLRVELKDENANPLYFVYYAKNKEPLKCFSKVYSDPFNPQKEYAAIMTCSDADEDCPVVFGAEKRFPIRYDDPKEYDGTDLEEIKYMERFEQIGIEMIFVFKNCKKIIDRG